MATIEYRVMVACREKLVAGVKTGVDPLADALFQEGILSDDLRDKVQANQPHMTQEQKAREIVATLETLVRDFGPTKYTLFVTILRGKSILFPQFGVLAAQLEDKMAELKTGLEAAGESQSVQTYNSKESEQNEDSYIRFECACGECDIQEFLNGRDCPNLPSKGPPQLSMWTEGSSRRVPTQADMQWPLYREQMQEQARKMNTKYIELLTRTCDDLKQKYSFVTAKEQVRKLITPQGVNKSLYTKKYSSLGRLRGIQTYEQLMKYIDNNFCSWFNIDLIADLRVALLGYETGDDAVLRYRESLRQYVKRLCFKRTTSQGKLFVCKVPTDLGKMDKEQYDFFEHELRQYVKLPECTRKVEGDVFIFTTVNQAKPRKQRTTQLSIIPERQQQDDLATSLRYEDSKKNVRYYMSTKLRSSKRVYVDSHTDIPDYHTMMSPTLWSHHEPCSAHMSVSMSANLHCPNRFHLVSQQSNCSRVLKVGQGQNQEEPLNFWEPLNFQPPGWCVAESMHNESCEYQQYENQQSQRKQEETTSPIMTCEAESIPTERTANCTSVVTTLSEERFAYIAPFQFKLKSFHELKNSDESFFSTPFFTNQKQYKMCTEVYANGNGEGQGTHVSIFICPMKGENDDSLTWPFTGTVTFELLNQLEDKNHHKKAARFREGSEVPMALQQVLNNDIGIGGGIPEFIAHSNLTHNPDQNCQYLKDDMLVFRVSVQPQNPVLNLPPQYHRFSSSFQCKFPKVQEAFQMSTIPTFIKPVEVFQVSSTGGQYRDECLGLTIDIPEGAVPKDTVLRLEIGMCLHGQFEFQGTSNVIAPILMLCPQEEIQLLKSIRITMPHIIEDAVNNDVEPLGIQAIKANHKGLEGKHKFDHILSDSNLSLSVVNEYSYATFSLSHFCFVTLRANTSIETEKRLGYCIYPLLPNPSANPTLGRFTYYLCVTYFMKQWQKAVEDQFSRRGYELCSDVPPKRFNFKGRVNQIQAGLAGTVDSGWSVILDSADENGIHVIDATSVEVWNKEEEELQLEVENLMYPPSFKIMANGQTATAPSFVTIHFDLNDIEVKNFSMTLPLAMENPVYLKGALAAIQSQPLTIEKLVNEGTLNENHMKYEISGQDTVFLARLFDRPSMYIDQFGLSRSDQEDINRLARSNTQEAMQKALQCWRQLDPKQATFEKLINIVLSHRRGDITRGICKYLAERSDD